MNYAIIRTGGKQFRVEPGATIRVPSIEKNLNESVELETLLIETDGNINFGADLAAVKATILQHGRGEKIIVFKRNAANSTNVSKVTGKVLPQLK